MKIFMVMIMMTMNLSAAVYYALFFLESVTVNRMRIDIILIPQAYFMIQV
jgi:hypothetical protein